MSLLEDQSASFIVRIWCERGEGRASHGEWRGSIEHVQSSQKAFFRELAAIERFMRPHLDALGIDIHDRFWETMADSMPEDADSAETAVTREIRISGAKAKAPKPVTKGGHHASDPRKPGSR